VSQTEPMPPLQGSSATGFYPGLTPLGSTSSALRALHGWNPLKGLAVLFLSRNP